MTDMTDEEWRAWLEERGEPYRPRIRKSLDYQGIARRAARAVADGTPVEYDTKICVCACGIECEAHPTIVGKKKRRFEVIDQSVQKARKEVTQDEAMKELGELAKELAKGEPK